MFEIPTAGPKSHNTSLCIHSLDPLSFAFRMSQFFSFSTEEIRSMSYFGHSANCQHTHTAKRTQLCLACSSPRQKALFVAFLVKTLLYKLPSCPLATLCEWCSPSATKWLPFLTLANLIRPRTLQNGCLNIACGQMAALLCLLSVIHLRHCWTPTKLIVFMTSHLCIVTSFLILDLTHPSNFDSICIGLIYLSTLYV
jgi:hypothetical protein